MSTFAGGGGVGYLESRDYPFDDSQGEHARFGEVRGIALDSKDNLYVADMFHYRIVSTNAHPTATTTTATATLLAALTVCSVVAVASAPQRKVTPEGNLRLRNPIPARVHCTNVCCVVCY